MVSISEAPQFSLISADPLEFTLTSTTTGGPPTTAEWTLPGGAIVSAENGSSQTLISGATSTVEHTLTITETLPGEYMFTTSNDRTTTPLSKTIMIMGMSQIMLNNIIIVTAFTAATPPTGLTAVQDSLTSILVSWTPPASGGASRTGYRISYQIDGGSEQSVDVGATATNHTLTGLQSGATYSISIVARSNQLPSTVVGPVTVTIEGALLLHV